MEQLELQVSSERPFEVPEGKPPEPSRPVGRPPEEGLRVYLERRTYRRMREYGSSDTSHELAGVLVGRAMKDGKGLFLVVEGFIEAEGAKSSKSAVTFTHEAWEHIFKALDQRWPGRAIVGWFHTHPGFGVFLSSYDRFIHQHFFREPWQMAVVLDPVAEEDGFFCWLSGRLEKTEGFFVFGEGMEEAGAAERALERAEQAFEEAQRARGAALRVAKRRDLAVFVLGVVALFGLGLALVANLRLSAALVGLREEVRALRKVLPPPAPVTAPRPKAVSPEEVIPSVKPKKPFPERLQRVYVVKEGDTLWGIAKKVYGEEERYKEIAKVNGLDPERDVLKPGMKLILPP